MISGDKSTFVGTCVNSFDNDYGTCIIDQLPWRDISEFEYSLENADAISQEYFSMNANVSKEIKQILRGHIKTYYLTKDNVWIIYDEDEDIHYFFV